MSRSRVWVVDASGPFALRDVLAAMGDDSVRALGEGRVFVGARRAADLGERLGVGARVEVRAPRASRERARVVARSDGLVIAFKPPDLPTEPDRAGAACLTREVAELLSLPSVHACSRLDVGVSGLVLLSETPAAHRRASELREAGAVHRRYLAVALAAPAVRTGSIDAPVDGRAARSRFVVVAEARPHRDPTGARVAPALLALCPETGRKHQLRRHAQALGTPLLGDRLCGGPRRLTTESGAVIDVSRVLLHAGRVEMRPEGGEPWVVVERPPADFVDVWRALGGAADALDQALAADCE
jgi:23S rRNA-/tRNA-specific pseudouridylate synthase